MEHRVPKAEFANQSVQQPLQVNNSSQQLAMPSQKDEEKMPLFLIKLWNIVEDPAYQNIIRWDETGYSFHIVDPYSFCRNVLPHYFKHNNLNSLIRQLNMYGFRKVSPLDKGGLTRSESDQDHLEFSHIYFIRGRPDLMVNIKRRQSNRAGDTSTVAMQTQNNLSVVMEELRQLRERQRNMDTKMNELTKENEALWDQLDHVRQQHNRQQQVVNKLVQFLVSIVQPNMSKRVLKRGVLAIDEPPSKRSRPSNADGNNTNLVDMLDRLQREIIEGGGLPQQKGYQNERGPIIADVTDEVYTPSPTNRNLGTADPHVSSPGSSDPLGMYSSSSLPQNTQYQKRVAYQDPTHYQQSMPSNQNKVANNQQVNSNQIAPSAYTPSLSVAPGLERQLSQDLQDYLNGVDVNIDSCRDLLSGNWDFDIFDNLGDEEHDETHPQLALEQAPAQNNLDFLGGTPEVGAHVDIDQPSNDNYPNIGDDPACTTPTLLTPCTSPTYH